MDKRWKYTTLPVLVLLTAYLPATGAEPFSGVYVHLNEFGDGSTGVEVREARMDEALDIMCACGFTTVIPYANTTSGKAFWPGTSLATVNADGWDILGVFARKARERSLKVMPALCLLASGHDAPAGILETHPDWALRDASGAPLGWLSPAHPEARVWIVELVKQLAAHIQPDGIMFDYARYPNQRDAQLDPVSTASLESPTTDEQAEVHLQRYKEEALSQLMASIAGALRSEHPGLRIGLYTWGPHVPFDHPVAQCWPDWIQDGHLDLLNVSGYCYPKNYGDSYLDVFENRLRDAGALAQKAGNVTLTFALGVRTSHGEIANACEMEDYLAIARQRGYSGMAAFAWGSMQHHAKEASARGYFRLSE
ncbi:MAG TPA: hypothetical protein ENN29_03735 [Candidatus Hydrogenedentes bacterium]|nr:hypothetical protein [Candidatus Hydrogenedentota bacterium]